MTDQNPKELRLLLVEDNPTDVLLLSHSLEEMPRVNFKITHCERLGESLDMLAGGQQFDLILLDLSLPDETGLRTFERTLAAAPRIPIVILTGLADKELPLQAIRGGAQDYVTKETLTSDVLGHALLCAYQRFQARQGPPPAEAGD